MGGSAILCVGSLEAEVELAGVHGLVVGGLVVSRGCGWVGGYFNGGDDDGGFVLGVGVGDGLVSGEEVGVGVDGVGVVVGVDGEGCSIVVFCDFDGWEGGWVAFWFGGVVVGVFVAKGDDGKVPFPVFVFALGPAEDLCAGGALVVG